jgi:hypothetical protein
MEKYGESEMKSACLLEAGFLSLLHIFVLITVIPSILVISKKARGKVVKRKIGNCGINTFV